MRHNTRSRAILATALLSVPSGATAQTWPLLGDLEANGGRNYAAVFCEDQPDATPLPMDPRELIAGANLNNPNYAVHFNDPFEICETDTLFATQAQQNEILGETVYTAKPRPQTCGEWRQAVDRGREYVLRHAITGEVLTSDSLVRIAEYLGYQIPSDPDEANELLAQVVQQRYGWPKSPYRNPFPFPGEDPNATDGGSGQLPIALVQVKDEAGPLDGEHRHHLLRLPHRPDRPR